MPDVAEHTPAPAQVIAGREIEVVAAAGIAAIVGGPADEVVGNRVVVFEGHRFPGQTGVDFGGVRVDRSRDFVAGIVVRDDAEVIAERVGEGAAKAAIEVHFEAVVLFVAASFYPIDVRAPQSDVESAIVRQFEAALDGGLVLCLRHTAKDIVAGGPEGKTERKRALGRIFGMGQRDAEHGQGGGEGKQRGFHESLRWTGQTLGSKNDASRFFPFGRGLRAGAGCPLRHLGAEDASFEGKGTGRGPKMSRNRHRFAI